MMILLTSPIVLLTYWSIALAISARFTPPRNFMLSTRGWCLSHQLSALSPASRVQWIRDCWPAPIPMTCKTKTWNKLVKDLWLTLISFSSCSYLSIFSIADRVGLSVLDGDGGHREVTHRFLRKLEDTEKVKGWILVIWVELCCF